MKLSIAAAVAFAISSVIAAPIDARDLSRREPTTGEVEARTFWGGAGGLGPNNRKKCTGWVCRFLRPLSGRDAEGTAAGGAVANNQRDEPTIGELIDSILGEEDARQGGDTINNRDVQARIVAPIKPGCKGISCIRPSQPPKCWFCSKPKPKPNCKGFACLLRRDVNALGDVHARWSFKPKPPNTACRGFWCPRPKPPTKPINPGCKTIGCFFRRDANIGN